LHDSFWWFFFVHDDFLKRFDDWIWLVFFFLVQNFTFLTFVVCKLLIAKLLIAKFHFFCSWWFFEKKLYNHLPNLVWYLFSLFNIDFYVVFTFNIDLYVFKYFVIMISLQFKTYFVVDFCLIPLTERCVNELMESKGGKKKSSSSSSSSFLYEAPLGYIIEDVRPNGGVEKFKSADYSNVISHFNFNSFD